MAEVAVRAPDGTVGTVDATDLSQMPEGTTIATPGDVAAAKQEAERQEKYGGVGDTLLAFGAGAARTASLGLSDPLITGIGGERARKALAAYQDIHPVATTLGEVTGVVAPALMGDEAGVGSVLGAPQRAVGAVGRAAEGAASSIVGRGAESLLGRVAQRAIPAAVGMGAEGAIYGLGNEISDAAIHDHELTAENLWAGAGRGALFGAGIGAVAGTVGQLVKEGTTALAKSGVGKWVEKQSLESTGRAAGVNKRIARKAEAYGDFDEMRRVWRDEAPGLVGKRNFARMTSEDMAQAAESGLARDGEKQMGTLAKADERLAKRGAEAFPKATDVISDLDRVADKLEASKLGAKPVANRLRDLADQARTMFGLVDENGQYVAGAADSRWTLSQAHEFRVRVDKEVGAFTENMGGIKAALRDVRSGLEQRIVDGVESAGGEALKESYEAAKKKMQAWYTLRDATKNAAAGGASNRFFGMSEQLGGVGGAVLGHAIGGPLGGLVTSGVGSLAAHAVRTRGDFIAADLLNRVSKLGALERANAVIEKRITDGVRGFLGRGAVQASEIGASQPKAQQRATRIAQQVTAMATDDSLRNQHVSQALVGLGEHAPNVATHAALKAQQSIFNLAQYAPKPTYGAASLTPMAEKLRYAPQEVYQFSRYLEGYEEPLSILDDIQSGHADPMKFLAVQENHPRLYEQIQNELFEQVRTKPDELSWDQKKIAAIFFGVPADDALQHDFIQRMQQGATQDASQGGQGQGQGQQQMGGRRPMDTDTSGFQTPSEQLGTPP